jgi:hypothetical protein
MSMLAKCLFRSTLSNTQKEEQKTNVKDQQLHLFSGHYQIAIKYAYRVLLASRRCVACLDDAGVCGVHRQIKPRSCTGKESVHNVGISGKLGGKQCIVLCHVRQFDFN